MVRWSASKVGFYVVASDVRSLPHSQLRMNTIQERMMDSINGFCLSINFDICMYTLGQIFRRNILIQQLDLFKHRIVLPSLSNLS